MREDTRWMARALELARRGGGATSPNPMVGAVLVREATMLGEGWHRRHKDLHAEREALLDCCRRGEDPRGATLYVTLEPCCHTGHQPPCTEAILSAGIARVVVGCTDTDPRVAGRGITQLREAGVEVDVGVLESRCRALNAAYFHFQRTGRPLVTLKYACTLDGKTASTSGASKWITGTEARAHVQRMRGRTAAIMVGVGTVIADDPLLTCRIEGLPSPTRVICDTHLRTPVGSQVVQGAREVPTFIATCCVDEGRWRPYADAGCEREVLPERDGHVDLVALVGALAARGINAVLVEGGSQLAWSAVSSGVVDRVMAYVAPSIMGGAAAKTPVGGMGFPNPGVALRLGELEVKHLGGDLLVEADVLGEGER